MRTDHDAHVALQPTHVDRTDWLMRQFVDDIKAKLAAHANHADLQTRMQARGIPHHVQRRILAEGRP